MARIISLVIFLLAAGALAAGAWLWQGAGVPDDSAGAGTGKGKPVGVVTVRAEVVDFPAEIEALGSTRARDAVEITSKSPNIIAAIRFEDGDEVEAGQVLVELENSEQQAQLAEARARLLESTSQFERSRTLAADRSISASQLEQLEATMKADQARLRAAEARLADTVIRAPFGGRMGLRRVSVGSFISPGTVITTLDDTSTMRLDLAVPESFLGTVGPGMRIRADSVAWPGELFDGIVESLDSRVDPVTRMITARAVIGNDDGRLKPGMFLTVRLIGSERKAIVVPEEALVPEGDRQYVFLVTDGVARRTLVELGRRRPGQAEILEGLVAGDAVIVEGTQKVVDGTAVSASSSLAVAGGGE